MIEPQAHADNMPADQQPLSPKSTSFRTFPELIRALDKVCEHTPTAECQDAFGAILEKTDLPASEWLPYALYDENKLYTRNLVHLNEHYALIVLRWNPAKESPIHDHPCDGCWLKVLDGSIEETIYTKDDVNDVIVEVSHSRYGCGSLTFMHDKIGLHKVSNISEHDPAISLHLYSPPFQRCKIWPRTMTASQFITPTVCFFSVGGVRVQDGAATKIAPVEDLTSLSWGREEEKKCEETKSSECA